MTSEYVDPTDPADLEGQSAADENDGEPQGIDPLEEADEGDVLEQATPVEDADDDYPNDLEIEPDV